MDSELDENLGDSAGDLNMKIFLKAAEMHI